MGAVGRGELGGGGGGGRLVEGKGLALTHYH